MFPQDLKIRTPENIDDLAGWEASSSELSITGKTKGVEKLKDCAAVDRIWITNVNQRQFENICGYINPISLVVYNMKVPDLSPLYSLTRVERLVMTWNSKAHDVDGLDSLTNLKVLAIRDFSKLSKLDGLGRCEKLEILELSGGMWAPLKVQTLEPLRSLKALRYLGLGNIKVDDDSLQPLIELRNLEKLDLSNQFPTEEYARLSVHLPHVQCSCFQPYITLEGVGIDPKIVMVIGRRKPFLDPNKDQNRIQRYVQKFREYQSLFLKEKSES